MLEHRMTPLQRARAALLRRSVSVMLESSVIRRQLAKRRPRSVDGRDLDEHLGAILGIDDLYPHSELSDLPLAAARALMVENIAIVEADGPRTVHAYDRTFKGLGGDVRARIYTPMELSGLQPTIAYFHGGGFVTCDIDTHDAFCRTLADGVRCRVISFDYRLAPEDRFPAALDDALSGVHWLFDRSDELGVDPSRVVVAGDSAGGNLSAVVAIRTRKETPRPALQVLIYPATDGTCAKPSQSLLGEGYLLPRNVIDFYYEQYTGTDPSVRLLPDVSPLLAPDLTGSPPALVYTCGFDPLRDEGRAYAEKLEAAGVQVEHHEFSSMVHGFALMRHAIPAARDAVDRIIRDIARHVHGR